MLKAALDAVFRVAPGAYFCTMRVSLHTLGCKQNAAETSHLRLRFEELGYTVVDLYEETDVLVLNTCTVTENADVECRKIIRRALRRSPNAKVAVTGCYAQLQPEELASVEGVRLVVGAKEKFRLPELSDELVRSGNDGQATKILVEDLADIEFVEAMVSDNDVHTRAFLKIQDGCDYSCTFCTIPQARGQSRSMELEQVRSRVLSLEEQGFKEIVLTGINLGEYLSSDGAELYDVLSMIDALNPALRVRVTSIEANKLKPSIIQLVANSSVLCPHFHIPLQSGSDVILAKMKRRYNTSMYSDVLSQIRQRMPHAAIGADIICGFPGETEELFEQSLNYIEQSSINYLHVFSYSERANTPAATMDETVPMNIRRQRTRRLRLLAEQKKRAFYASQRGRRSWVVSEGFDAQSGMSNGWTNNYVRVQYAVDAATIADAAWVELGEVRGEFVQARLDDAAASRIEASFAKTPAYIPLVVFSSSQHTESCTVESY